MNKAASILLKAQSLGAKPAELLEVALRNLKAGEKQLVPTKKEQLSIGILKAKYSSLDSADMHRVGGAILLPSLA